MRRLAVFVAVVSISVTVTMLSACGGAPAQPNPLAAGRVTYGTKCTKCHGPEANGTKDNPSIAARLAAMNDEQLQTMIRSGNPTRGMPGQMMDKDEMDRLVAYLRSVQRAPQPGTP